MGDVQGDWLMPILALPLEDYLEKDNPASPRGSSHGLDSLIAGQSRSKTVKNWMGFKPLGGLWQESNNHGRDTSIAHAGLGYSTQWAWDSGPQQLYVSSLPSQAPQGGMVKAAVAHRPDLWVSSAVVNAVNGVTPTRTDTSVTHVNLMPEGGTKHVDIGPEKYNERYSYAGMPSEYPRVGYAVPDGCTIERTANGRALRFMTHETGDGVQYMHTQDAYGWWGTAEVSLIIQNVGGVELVPQGTQLILGKTYHIFDLVPVAAEWASSFGQVHIDPNVTISGDANIGGTIIYKNQPQLNYGGHTVWISGFAGASAAQYYSEVFRYDETSIPSGDITLHQLTMWQIASGISNGNGSSKLYAIAAGNDWVRGTKIGASENGSGCWNEAKYLAQTWIGGTNGCNGTGDHDATDDGGWSWSAKTSGPDTQDIITLGNDIAMAWGPDGSRVNNGFVFVEDDLGTYGARAYVSASGLYTADPTHQPSIYIEYTEPALGNPHYYYNMLKRRR